MIYESEGFVLNKCLVVQRKMLEESGKMVKDLAGKLGASVQDLRQLVVSQLRFFSF